MARTPTTPAEQQLKELAAKEAAAAKQRLTARTTAARQFAAADGRLSELQAALELAQGEAATAKGSAVRDLIDSGMKPVDVAELLGIDAKELRAIRAAVSVEEPADSPAPAKPGTLSQGEQSAVA